MLWPKNNSYKESDNEKNSCGSKIQYCTCLLNLAFHVYEPLDKYITMN